MCIWDYKPVSPNLALAQYFWVVCFLLLLLLCVCVRAGMSHAVHVEFKRHLVGVGFLYHVGPGNRTQVV